MSDRVLFFVIGFLAGGLAGTVLVQEWIRSRLLVRTEQLPWRAKSRLAMYFGFDRWAVSCSKVEAAHRALYATIVIASLWDLGGPALLHPKSKAAFEGMLAEVERRYAESIKRRK